MDNSAIMSRRALLAATGALGGAALLAGPSLAFPVRPVSLIVPFAPAGGTDIAARALGERLSARLGQQVVIDNRPGANGVIAGQALLGADTDGHALLVATAASFAAAPALGQKLPYDVEKDFTAIGMLGLFPLVVYASPSLPVTNMAEFVAYAKSRPGALNFASAGVGGTNHLVFEMIMQATGLKLEHVPYRGAALASADVMTGQVQVMVDSLAASLGNIQGGKLKPLAVTTANRQPQVPDVPTLKEAGVDLVYPGWASVVGPARMPAERVRAINEAMNAAMADEALVKRYRDLVIEPAAWSPAETAAFMANDRATLVELVRKTGIKLQ
jgi:tripartite-type tricarboxylate transporter receptor subunit TctC